MSATASVKGWCPGAFRPMMSGDGLIVRVRPFFARLTAAQVTGLCALALDHGNGFLDLTNRANIQIRGVQEAQLEKLLAGLDDLGLLDETPEGESRRNVMITPFWRAGDDSHWLYQHMIDGLSQLPDLPAKFGFCIDAGAAPVLSDASGDIRIERGGDGLILRAEGAALGRPVTCETALDAVQELARWFAARRTAAHRRMSHVLAHHDLPAAWRRVAPRAPVRRPVPGPQDGGVLLGAAFGQIDATGLLRLMQDTGAPGLRITPWRLLLIEGVARVEPGDFVARADDPLLRVDACPGAPHCPSATVATRDLARHLAPHINGTLHVSGCAKGCARKGCADTTIVGNQGRFDLVLGGHAWDAPAKSGLKPSDLRAEVTSQR